MSSMHSCFTGIIYIVLGAMWTISLSGQMFVQANLKMQERGILYQDTQVLPLQVVIQRAINWFGIFLPLDTKRGRLMELRPCWNGRLGRNSLNMERVFFLNAAKVVAHLRGKANKYRVIHPKARQHINKFFNKMKVGDIDRIRHLDCSTVKGSQSKHQVHYLSSKNTTLLVLLIVLLLC